MADIAEHYTEYHPRWLRQHVSTYWWLGKWSYFAFILREISSLFVAWAVVVSAPDRLRGGRRARRVQPSFSSGAGSRG